MITEIKEIGDKGEFVIPKEIRDEQGLQPKDKIRVTSTSKGIIVMPIKKSFKEFAGILGKKGIQDSKQLEELATDIMYS
jgi:AbrB family looped-hinge helix DNA binding protein